MPAKAFASDKWLRLYLEPAALRDEQSIAYNLGSALTGFLRVDAAEIGGMYDVVISKCLNVKGGRLSEHDTERLKAAMKGINSKSPYIIYYSDILAGVLLSVVMGRPFDMARVFKALPMADELYAAYKSRFESDCGRIDELLASYYPLDYLSSRAERQKLLMLRSVHNILYIKEAIICDINEKKAALSAELETLYGDFSGAREFKADPRRLVALDLERGAREGRSPYYVNSEQTTERALLTGGMELVGSLEGLDAAALEREGIGIYELYRVERLDELIRFELFKTLENSVLIRRCENCGGLFAPSGRIDTIYCGDSYSGTGKTCSEIGALNRYREKTVADPVREAFSKAYKRNNSRVRNNKMSRQEFAEWLITAKQKRAACMAGEMTAGEFSAWLGNKDRPRGG